LPGACNKSEIPCLIQEENWKASILLDCGTGKYERGTDDRTLDNMDILRKKFEDFALLMKKNKPNPGI